MITVYPYETLGHANHGWLDARHHFSFANYYNPDRMGFGVLRVINDDKIKAGSGFPMHAHRDMEIITFVRSGAITHRDSHGNHGRTEAGSVQVMSAGRGIHHSEFNLESEDTSIFQIWIEPKEDGITPRWDMASFNREAVSGALPLLASGRSEDEGKGALYIHQDAAISGGSVKAGTEIVQAIKGQAYILVSSGEIEIYGQSLPKGTGLEVTDLESLSFKALTDAEVIVIDVPKSIN